MTDRTCRPGSRPSGAEAVAAASLAYRRQVAGKLALLGGAAAALAALAVADLLVGPAFLRPELVMRALLAPGSVDPTAAIIVWDIRLPMTLMGVAVGMALGIAGVLMQTILGNPLASPYTLGLSAAAGFGASVAILTGFTLPVLGLLTVPASAFLAAAAASAMVYGIAHVRGMGAEVMVLAGIAILFLFQSLQSLAQYLAAPEVLQAIVFWLFGSLLKANWETLPVTAAILAVAVSLLLPDIWQLTALRLGDARAEALGIDVSRLRIKVLALSTLLTAGAVAFVGTIGFVGLVAPHVARMLIGEDQRFLLPMAGIAGGGLLCGASIVSKLVSPGMVVPIGIVTATIGVPALFLLILKGGRRFW